MHAHHMLHILAMLTADYHRYHQATQLYHAYLRDHALVFLKSGITSGSGGKSYLHWLTWHHVAPVDW